ncbi:glycerol-3-phosphate dehydrogenase 1-like protein, partial [Cricetulus griseus]
VAVPNLSEAVQDADLLVFVIPHQFIHKICDEITGRVPKKALGITLIKGIDEGPEGLRLISDIIREKMDIDISVLMGANIASEVAAEKFCETTIGSKVMQNGLLFKELLQTPNFRITVVDDADTVELCGALKNIVAVGAGFCDGLRCGDNTKAAVIRLGLMEMIAFAKIFCKGQVSTATFLESCGVADLITTCYGGRNRKVAEAFARTGKTIEELEKEMLNGQKLQGPQTSAEVYRILKQKGLLDKVTFDWLVYPTHDLCVDGLALGFVLMGGNEKLWILAKLIKMRFDQGRPPENLGYRHEERKQEKLQDRSQRQEGQKFKVTLHSIGNWSCLGYMRPCLLPPKEKPFLKEGGVDQEKTSSFFAA